MENKKPNRLINALSPYLQQHAYNPVDWQEWGPAAFAQAERENKLMLISIGYSACHWCHVMAHESFEDAETAALMNRYFVCIKIDREELPDVDQLYMDACQLVSGSGGWPLNAFALPDKRPVHALTYAPRAQWQKILEALHALWADKQATAYEYAEKLSHGIRNLSLPPALSPDQKKPSAETILEGFRNRFDYVYGGNGKAPKFPMPSVWRTLLQAGRLMQDQSATDMALLTLKQMALGGIYDAVGGGFARYSVDEKWFAPHFEKMLYDNAQLISLYSYAYAVSGDPFYKTIAMQTLDFCKSEWLGDDGLYRSALDADSEGVEGLYYTYSDAELKAVLGEDYVLFARYFQCNETGNWEHGRNILFALDRREQAAPELGTTLEKLNDTLDICLEKLRQVRKKRVKPGLDDKCICAWNNLMLKALSEAALWLNESTLTTEAETLAERILNTYYEAGELKRIYKNGSLKINAYLEDYATLADGLTALYQCSLNDSYLLRAHAVCEETMQHFYHSDKGFFAFSSGETLVSRKYDTTDDVICSGNSIMAHTLWKLSWYFDRSDWQNLALGMATAMQPLLESSGPWYSHWAAFVLLSGHETAQYILSADPSLQNTLPFGKQSADPNALFGYAGQKTEIPLFKGKEYQGKNQIFPCRDKTCYLPLALES